MADNLSDLNSALNDFNTIVMGLAERNDRNKYNTQVLDLSKDAQAWSQDFNERQFKSSLDQWNQSFAFNTAAADLAQNNFLNATQIRADDMQKAGLNPLNLVGGAEGSTANFMSGSQPAGSASSSGASPLSPNSVAELLSHIAEMRFQRRENALNRVSAEKIARMQVESSENVAQISADSSRYGADRSFSASSNRDLSERTISLWNNEIRRAELSERSYEFDKSLEKDLLFKGLDADRERTLELVRQKGENARALASVSADVYKSALSGFNNAIRNHVDFALGVANLRQAYDALEYAKSRDDKDRELKRFQGILDDCTRQLSAFTNLAGDVSRGFLLRNVIGGR